MYNKDILKLVMIMRIKGIDVKQIAKLYGQTQPRKGNKEIASSMDKRKQDSMSISPKTRELQKLVDHAQQIDVSRVEKIEELKNSIEACKYRISPEQLADKLIQYMKDQIDTI